MSAALIIATSVAARRATVRATRRAATRSLATDVPDDHYDLRAVGADAPMPYEVNGEPTDITKVLANGQKQVGYSSRYARNWSRIFAPSTESSMVPGPVAADRMPEAVEESSRIARD